MTAPSYCPGVRNGGCGVETRRSNNGHDSLCLPCTEEELGKTYDEIRKRAVAASGVKPDKRGRYFV